MLVDLRADRYACSKPNGPPSDSANPEYRNSPRGATNAISEFWSTGSYLMSGEEPQPRMEPVWEAPGNPLEAFVFEHVVV